MQWLDNKEGKVLEIVKDNHITKVAYGDLKHSSDFLYAKGFACCHAFVFLDDVVSIGAVGHMTSYNKPLDLLSGKGGFKEYTKLTKIEDIFANPQSVKVKHIYHRYWNLISEGEDTKTHGDFCENAVEGALRIKGFQDIEHIPLYPNAPDGFHQLCSRDIALDTKSGRIYVFPSFSLEYLII